MDVSNNKIIKSANFMKLTSKNKKTEKFIHPNFRCVTASVMFSMDNALPDVKIFITCTAYTQKI